jgi:EAL domain-containing protein (putative c-di-GMP-specific phosphodiesterase class I)
MNASVAAVLMKADLSPPGDTAINAAGKCFPISAVEDALRHAISRNELKLHYQPKVCTRSGSVTGVEALLRWTARDLGPVTPDVFIRIAENSGLINDIGAWVIEEACRQVADWRTQGIRLNVAINISQAQLLDPLFIHRFEEVFSRYPASHGAIELEITESLMMEDVELAVSTCTKIVSMDVNIAIDDFGTGHSCLARLTTLPVSKIKIDRHFISNIDTESGLIVVAAIIDMAHALKISVTAEGVETAGQLRALQQLRCDEAQGFLFSKPVPALECIVFGHPFQYQVR